jgi:quercetin dioxygenase-like cupin family protein
MSTPVPPNRIREAAADRLAPLLGTFSLSAAADELRREPRPPVRGHRQKVLARHGTATVALFVFDDAGELAPHAAGGTVVIQCVEGELMVTASTQDQSLRPGEIVVMAPDVRHSVRAEGPSVMLLTVALQGSKASS